MIVANLELPLTYHGLNSRLGNRLHLTLCRNTKAVRLRGGWIAIYYYATAILCYFPDGEIVVQAYNSVSTRYRKFLGNIARVYTMHSQLVIALTLSPDTDLKRDYYFFDKHGEFRISGAYLNVMRLAGYL